MPRNFSNNRSQYASSRKAKLEQKKITHQIIFFLLLAIALVLLFVFVLIPTLIRVLASLSGNTPVQTDTVPVQVPFLSAPVAATSSATLTLSGFSQKGYNVAFVDNGQPLTTTNTNDDGSFQADLTLSDGENKITAYAIDANKKQSEVSQEYTVLLDTQLPSLDISKPQDKQSFQGKQNQNMTIEGKTDLNTKVYINDRLIFTKDDGSFTTLQQLHDGDNPLDIKAIDQAGNVTDKVLTISFHQ